MKSRSVPYSEITGKDNPGLCLSAKRYLGHCFQCPRFKNKKGEYCPSVVHSLQEKAYFKNKAQIEKLKEKLTELEAKQLHLQVL